jgi:predicted O-linked N-acetylglucosamine transferase (SPINDLY family)
MVIYNYPEISPLPSLTNQDFWFACLNAGRKVNRRVAQVWSRILTQVPHSRLLICDVNSDVEEKRIIELFSPFLENTKVLSFQKRCSLDEFFKTMSRVDIALDPFPYAGGTTTVHSLNMGIPVVTLAGNTSVGLGGVSILNRARSPEFIARTEDEYVDCAVKFARDREYLSVIRQSLRERILTNPENDPTTITRHLEAAYRTAWGLWCSERDKSLSASSSSVANQ